MRRRQQTWLIRTYRPWAGRHICAWLLIPPIVGMSWQWNVRHDAAKAQSQCK